MVIHTPTTKFDWSLKAALQLCLQPRLINSLWLTWHDVGWQRVPCSWWRKTVAHTRLPSVGFRSWSRFFAVSLQVMWVINPTVGCHYFPPGLQLPSQPLRGLLPILLLGEQRHNGCKQFAQDCYPTVSRLRFEPGPFCAWVQHAYHSATWWRNKKKNGLAQSRIGFTGRQADDRRVSSAEMHRISSSFKYAAFLRYHNTMNLTSCNNKRIRQR